MTRLMGGILSLFFSFFFIGVSAQTTTRDLSVLSKVDTLFVKDIVFDMGKEYLAVQLDSTVDQFLYLVLTPAVYETAFDTLDMASRIDAPPYLDNPWVYKSSYSSIELELIEDVAEYTDVEIGGGLALLGVKYIEKVSEFAIIYPQIVSEDSIQIVEIKRMAQPPKAILTNNLDIYFSQNKSITAKVKVLFGTWIGFKEVFRTCRAKVKILEVQNALIRRGYLVPRSGIMDKLTSDALRRFGNAHNIKFEKGFLLTSKVLTLLGVL